MVVIKFETHIIFHVVFIENELKIKGKEWWLEAVFKYTANGRNYKRDY